MELHALARLWLESPRLQDKLFFPETLTDDAPGDPSQGPVWPARPEAVRLDVERPPARFPRGLESDRARGEVLHFFANHELLALELMALALLRFPDAPRPWRMGLAHVVRDEQRHMRAYLDRMTELGVDFGQVPVSAFFWTALAPMSRPLDLAAGMALTFEQANLDFCQEYAGSLRRVGDTGTAALLDQVYEDEIEHVAHGLRWYRRWTPPGSDWRTFAGVLPPPLTPRRARGSKVYDVEGRRRAGFDAEWIDELRVYTASRGRSPRVHWFNPGCERAMAEPGWTPPKGVARLRADLAPCMGWLARRDDAVWVARRPSARWLGEIQRAGLPELEWVTELPPGAQVVPFGPGPEADAVLGDRAPAWQIEHFRKSTLGEAVRSMDALEDALRGPGPWRLKQDLGSSGQGQRVVTTLDAGTRAWAQRILDRQGAVVVEPELDRVLDLSAVFEGDRLVALGRSVVDGRGAWRGQWVAQPWHGLDPALRRFLHQDDAVRRTYVELGRTLALPGRWGLDGMVHRVDGALTLRPVVERNARVTMGHIAAGMARHVRAGRQALWWVDHRVERAQTLIADHPLQASDGGILAGCVPTNDPAHAQGFLGVLCVGTAAVDAALKSSRPERR